MTLECDGEEKVGSFAPLITADRGASAHQFIAARAFEKLWALVVS